jgi:alanyl-tRNA synthetase
MRTNELRQRFLTFFESKDHTVVPSDSLVPTGDPTLLFTSAGMNQFKDQFMGRSIAYPRAASCQKCLRTADLDNVGKTAYHHTFFEMLGNFSFGDYFKQEAIVWAWEFMTEVLKLPEKKLWVSVYNDDDETYAIWRDAVKVPEKKIIRLGDKENFWPSNAKQEGPNGPCGPCSEIFYDWGAQAGCGKKKCDPRCDCGRFVEVWNLVFTQYNRTGVNQVEPLASKNIDTGMGLERLASVMQGVPTNFETDAFQPIIAALHTLLEPKHLKPSAANRTPTYAIADHIRAVSFAILDGVMPSNEGRGYVVRKLIRTAFLHGRKLGMREPFLYKLVFSVAKTAQDAYPELGRRHEDIAGVIKSEEESFVSNLDEGRAEALYDEKFKEHDLSQEDTTTVSARVACFMNDTYGIPPEVTRELAESKNHITDERQWKKEYGEAVEQLRELSRKKSAFETDIFATANVSVRLLSEENIEFVGHETTEARAKVIGILGEEMKRISEAHKGDDVLIILNKTPFYGEAGGQVGDTGTLESDAVTVEVTDTKRSGDVIVHIAKVREGSIKVGGTVTANVDRQRRRRIEKNHTATHLLHNALRSVLGEHVHQSGSVVDDKRLRFDFTHAKKVTPSALRKIEAMVNNNIQQADTVTTKQDVELHKARDEGAIALFGEKYADRVRVVSVGGYSKELCGGTHVANVTDIRLFKIMSEGSVAAGLRRIEAVTDEAVGDHVVEEESALIKELQGLVTALRTVLDSVDETSELKTRAEKILIQAKEIEPMMQKPLVYQHYRKWEDTMRPRITELLEVLKDLKVKIEKDIFASKVKETTARADEIITGATKIGQSLVIAQEIKHADPKALSFLVDEVKKKIASGIVLLATQEESRISFACAVTADLVGKGLHAGTIVKEVATRTGGGGGGRPDFAMAGGKDPSRLSEALDYVYALGKQELTQ